MEITIKSYNGIGDLLMATPAVRVIKEAYPEARLVVNTNHPALLAENPFVDAVNESRDGLFLSYPDPIHRRMPKQHHVLTDWEIICNAYGLMTRPPAIRPEAYIPLPDRRRRVGVNVWTSDKYQGKKAWPYTRELVEKTGWGPMPKARDVVDLVRIVAGYSMIVTCEGGVHHIAAAVGTPAVVIYGGFIRPEWTGYDGQIAVTNRMECSDACYNTNPCSRGDLACWRDITAPEVVEAGLKLQEARRDHIGVSE